MKTFILFLLISSSLYSQTPAPGSSECRSQLMRMQIDNNAIGSALQNSQTIQSRAVPALQTYLSSDSFRSSFLGSYPLPAVGFPFDYNLCLREKARDPLFRDINCEDPQLCGTSEVSTEVRTRLCFALPCSFVMGSRMDQCRPDAVARPNSITFTSPVELRAVNLIPENVSIEGNVVRSCFKMNALDVGVGIGIDFDHRPTRYESIALNNLNLNLDGERKICLTANIDLTRTPILSGVNIEHTSGGPFVSDAMIDRALRGSTVSGLEGYTPETLEILKMTGLPPMARHFRPTIENAIAEVLSKTFETTVSGYLGALNQNKGPTRVDTPADSMVSELGVGNLAVKKYVDLLDCSLMKRERVPVPADHACLTTSYPGSDTPYRESNLPTPERAVARLKEVMGRNSNVTSESIKSRLTNFEGRMRALNLAPLYQREITPIINQIAVTQSNSTLLNGIELVGQLSSDAQLSVGFCLPEICDQERPSSHAGRSIPNCPIQTYVDINELNNLMKAMYDSGRLCHRGRGDFVPRRNARGEIVRDRSGMAAGEGCLFAVEEDPDGLRCYLNGPPTLKFDPATRRYNVDLKTRECFRGGVFAGIGKIGGDINFNIGFTPSICNGGDFCLENGEASWNVVPGTARFALRESSWLNSMVRKRIDGNLRDIVSNSIRFPLSSTQGPLSNIPLAPEGRVDMGDGYFGACLQIR